MLASSQTPGRGASMRTLTTLSVDRALAAADNGGPHPLAVELAITRVCRQHADPLDRELACLEVMFPAILGPIEPGDLLAGRISYPLVGLSIEPMNLGYYCCFEEVRRLADAARLDAASRAEVDAMIDFWRGRTTAERVRAAFPPEVAAALPSDRWTDEAGIAFPLYRIAGTVLDYGKLLRLGLPGLRDELAQREIALPAVLAFFRGMARALSLVEGAAVMYAAQATALAIRAEDPRQRCDLLRLAAALEALPLRAPQSLLEAAQLAWLYALLTGTWNYGRMDVWLGSFLQRDLASGRLDEAAALRLLQSFWRLMTAYDNQYNNRVFLGGVGRPDEPAADAFALLAMEATRTVLTNQPQLSLRFHERQNPALMAKALDALAEGRTFPILYNDDVNVPAVMQAFGVDRAEAEQYTPFGCGEYTLAHRGIESPNAVINLAYALQVTLHESAGHASFESLWDAWRRQLERHIAATAVQQRIEYDVVSQDAPLLLVSLLYDDCVARGKPLLGGGARYLGGTLETYGNTNVADAFTAIDELVFRSRRYSLPQIVAACDADFAGYDSLRRALLAAPKYGNDHDQADNMARRVHDCVCRVTQEQATRAGLDSYLVVIINNWANAILGGHTGALPDGRKAGEPLSNGNNPTQGMDRNGATAFLNSLAKLDPTIHAGAVQNMKLSRSLFTHHRPIVEALLRTWFDQGGTQAMITVVDRAELEAAMREPEKWGHLMVRVGGFSARFIDLPREAQLDVLRRTLY